MRNIGIAYAYNLGCPFILYLGAGDYADPRRLELVRKSFKNKSLNVVHTSFDTIDEYGELTPMEEINPAAREIIEGHRINPVEGENAWLGIVMRKITSTSPPARP